MSWTVDTSHAEVQFAVKHMAIATVKGHFKSFTAGGEMDASGIPSSVQMEIQAASISTNNEQRDEHLRSADFFDVEKYPTITFKSTSISGTADDLKIVGDLTMRGITNPVTLTGELSRTINDPWGSKRVSLAVSGKVSRKEWGLTWNQALEFGGVMVSDDVKLSIEAEATESK